MTKKNYPFSDIEIQVGDILYSTIGRSTYYVGHSVIVGTDYLIKESIPGKPSGHSLTIEQFWGRHHEGDKVTLLRAKEGAKEAAQWATENLDQVQDYYIGNFDINNVEKNYCSKFIVQAYYFGANVKLSKWMNRFISPQYLKRTAKLEKIAVFLIS